MADKKCADVVRGAWKSRKEDLELLFRLYQGEDVSESDNPDGCNEDSLNEYGLCFDYVEPGTFNDQKEGYWRYQISYGGPSQEIRFYSSDQRMLYKAEFWHLDWFDGAKVDVKGEDVAGLLWEMFCEVGSVANEYEKAVANA